MLILRLKIYSLAGREEIGNATNQIFYAVQCVISYIKSNFKITRIFKDKWFYITIRTESCKSNLKIHAKTQKGNHKVPQSPIFSASVSES